jgi:hypothetical protein
MNGAGQQGDAVPADLVAEVLAGNADSTRAGNDKKGLGESLRGRDGYGSGCVRLSAVLRSADSSGGWCQAEGTHAT